MIRNYLKIGLRNLKRNKAITAINIFGLTFGLAISSLITLYVQNELTYDSFHKDSENIYRVFATIKFGEMTIGNQGINAPIGPYLVEHYPKVIAQTRVSDKQEKILSFDNKAFEELLFYADSSFFQIFSYNFIYGNPVTALCNPFSLVLTKKMAMKFFGDVNPIGSVIKDENNKLYTITGVIENVPENSHLKFDILCSFSTLYNLIEGENKIDGWGELYKKYTTYIKITPDYSPDELTMELVSMSDIYLSDDTRFKYNFSLQPLEKIYLDYSRDPRIIDGIRSRITLFGVIGIFVLLIACINYMNLNTADSVKRLKEIGMRKVLGSDRNQLIRQLVFESVMLSLFSLVLALTLAEILLPVFNSILQKNLNFEYLNNWPLSLMFIGIAVFTGFLAGSYPAFYLSSIKPVNALKGKFVFGTRHAILRNALVVLQFAITIFLICCTGIIFMQLRYNNKSDLGFQKDDILILELIENRNIGRSATDNESYQNARNLIKNELANFPEISNISMALGFPFISSVRVMDYIFEELENEKRIYSYNVDTNFIDLLKLKLIGGEGFAEDNSSVNKVIINEAFAKELNWGNPIGKTFKSNGKNPIKHEVIGLVKNFHTYSFREKIYPFFLTYSEMYTNYIGFEIKSGNAQDLINKIESVCSEHNLPYSVKINFLSQYVEDAYMEDYRTGKMFTNFAIIAIIIASMGLYGLALFVSRQKTKEIGVRKVLGGSVGEIILILSKNFMKLVILSALIGVPVAWYYMDKWLQSFVYQVENRWIIFVLATMLAMVIAFATILYQSYKAATSNPVDALKYE